MGLRADFKQFSRLIKGTRKLADPKFYKGLNAALGQEALEQIDAGFAEVRDPYGRPWKKSARAARQSGQTLTNTTRLRRSFSRRGVRATAGGFTVGTSVIYAETHQSGRVIKAKRKATLKFKVGERWISKKEVTIPQRQMVPEGQLGPIWERALEDAAQAYFAEALDGD